MNVILLEQVDNLGTVGDRVNVKNGYARNFLIPQKKAVRATEDQIKYFESQRAVLEAKAAALLKEAQDRAEKLQGVTLNFTMLASEEGKLFGSVAPVDIAAKLVEQGFDVQKKEIDMPEGPMHHVGEAIVHIHLLSQVMVPLNITVQAQEDE